MHQLEPCDSDIHVPAEPCVGARFDQRDFMKCDWLIQMEKKYALRQ